MRLKINDNLSLPKYLLRTLILHNVLANSLKLIFVLTLNKGRYIIANDVIMVATFIIEVAIILTITLRKDNRGLHDLIVGSSVEIIPKNVEGQR